MKESPLTFLDCDVEEPNAHFFLNPEFERERTVSVPVPEVNEDRCNFCGKCAEICVFNALAVLKDSVLVFPELCHGCGGCRLLCPERAITEKDRRIGIVSAGEKNGIRFVSGRLDIGQVMSPPLIRSVKKHISENSLVIIDAPPGASCPMMEAVKGSDFCILVTEPTPFGLNDLILAAETLKKMNIPSGVVINRAGKGDSGVEDFCHKKDLPVLMQIPLDKKIAAAYSRGESLLAADPSYENKLKGLYGFISELVLKGRPSE
jgi:MinD superfamily P-loop ATPase